MNGHLSKIPTSRLLVLLQNYVADTLDNHRPEYRLCAMEKQKQRYSLYFR